MRLLSQVEELGYDINLILDNLLRSLAGVPYRRPLTQRQKIIYELNRQGLIQSEIAEKMGTRQGDISRVLKTIERKGFSVLRNKGEQYF